MVQNAAANQKAGPTSIVDNGAGRRREVRRAVIGRGMQRQREVTVFASRRCLVVEARVETHSGPRVAIVRHHWGCFGIDTDIEVVLIPADDAIYYVHSPDIGDSHDGVGEVMPQGSCFRAGGRRGSLGQRGRDTGARLKR